MAIERLIDFEEIAESEPEDRSNCKAEEGQNEKIEEHPKNDLYSLLWIEYVKELFWSS